MTRSTVFAAIVLSLTVGTTPVFAEDTSSGAKPPSSQTSAADKRAVAKSCTDQANAKGLHGKARKKFRSECKKKGGKVE